jgi:Flp pilus assembly pilin Flp
MATSSKALGDTAVLIGSAQKRDRVGLREREQRLEFALLVLFISLVICAGASTFGSAAYHSYRSISSFTEGAASRLR